MTTRPKLVRTVFTELVSNLGETFSHNDLLASANAIVEVALPKREDDLPNFSLRTGGLPFDQWSTDAGMRDGGWKVFSRERELISDLYEDEFDINLNRTLINEWFAENAA